MLGWHGLTALHEQGRTGDGRARRIDRRVVPGAGEHLCPDDGPLPDDDGEIDVERHVGREVGLGTERERHVGPCVVEARVDAVVGKELVGSVTRAQVEEIAKIKMNDLNARDLEHACRIVMGTARSAGIEIKG